MPRKMFLFSHSFEDTKLLYKKRSENIPGTPVCKSCVKAKKNKQKFRLFKKRKYAISVVFNYNGRYRSTYTSVIIKLFCVFPIYKETLFGLITIVFFFWRNVFADFLVYFKHRQTQIKILKKSLKIMTRNIQR